MEHKQNPDLVSRLNDALYACSPEVGRLAEAMITALEGVREKETKMEEKRGPCWIHNECPVKLPLNLSLPGINGAVLPVGSLVGDPDKGQLKIEIAGSEPIIRIKPGAEWRALAFDALKEAAGRIVLGTPTSPDPESDTATGDAVYTLRVNGIDISFTAASEAKAEKPSKRADVAEVIPVYKYRAAGRVWHFANVELDHSRYDDGNVLPGRESKRMTDHVASEVLKGNAGSVLKGIEIEYLTELSAKYTSEVDAALGVPEGTVSTWIDGELDRQELTLELSDKLRAFFRGCLFPSGEASARCVLHAPTVAAPPAEAPEQAARLAKLEQRIADLEASMHYLETNIFGIDEDKKDEDDTEEDNVDPNQATLFDPDDEDIADIF